MKRVCFVDFKNDGHHWNYNLNVIKSQLKSDVECIYYTSNIDEAQQEKLKELGVKIEIRKYNNKTSILYILNNFKVLLNTLLFCNKNNIDELFLLYLDPFIIQLYFLKMLFNKKVVATLHWYPNKKIKIKLLQRLKNKVLIIVHTDKMLKDLNSKAKLIYYPNFENENLRKNKKINNRVTLLYFGALRLDKGVDILLESLKYTKSEFNLIIAGKEASFSRDFVMKKVKDINKERLTIDINYISDEKMNEYYECSDVVIIPYRKHFLGESGILIDAITKGKVIISTDISNSKEIISRYFNGEIFDFEDFMMLANKIDLVVRNIEKYNSNAHQACKFLKEKHSLENFIEEYKKV